MSDILTVVTTAISSIKVATDIAQILKDTDKKFEQAEFKMKLADMLSALADAKIKITEMLELVSEKDKVIKNLLQAAEINGKIIYHEPFYWLEDGTSKDGPFCQQCRDSRDALMRLQRGGGGHWSCKTCRNSFKEPGAERGTGRSITDDD